jgi:phosphoribosylformimino-5-aminoimidazole carboxamide ribotide isomerase
MDGSDSPAAPPRTRFRPCIDLRGGKVVQIVGGTLRDDAPPGAVTVNHESAHPAAYFAALYRSDGMTGGHVIQLGPGNEEAARAALAAWPGGLQIGGGVGPDNALEWLRAGASHVIVTSHLFDGPVFRPDRLESLSRLVGRERLVVDLSCRRRGPDWVVATNRWQTLTNFRITPARLDEVCRHCAELLVHAADVEGQCLGIDADLVRRLGAWGGCPVTYAGGAREFADLALVDSLSGGRVDLTIGSALDLFGGVGVRYAACVAWNREHAGDGTAPGPG